MVLSAIEPPLELTTDNCHTIPLDRPITLYAPGSEGLTPFTAIAVQLILIKQPTGNDPRPIADHRSEVLAKNSQESRLKDCHLVLSVSFSQYQQVLEQALFHLKPEVRGPLQQADFLPDQPILLELGLQPQAFASVEAANREKAFASLLLNQLLTILETQPSEKQSLETQSLETQPSTMSEPGVLANDFLTTLLGDGPDAPTNDSALFPDPRATTPWLQTENWLCRSVQQRQADQTVGYATLWAYATPEQAEPVVESGTAALDAVSALLQKTMAAMKAEVEQELPYLKQRLSDFSDELITALEQVDWDAVLTMPQSSSEPAAQTVSSVVKQFFDEDDWAYVQLSDPSVLQLAFQGDAGRWTCLAQSDDDAQQAVFYSLCPISVPGELYGEIAELLMRANDGLVIGNFELSFSTGEIRYKTSLDVEGDRLTPALVRQLVYINVQTLDIYLPGILAVLEGSRSPAEAIEAIEEAPF